MSVTDHSDIWRNAWATTWNLRLKTGVNAGSHVI